MSRGSDAPRDKAFGKYAERENLLKMENRHQTGEN